MAVVAELSPNGKKIDVHFDKWRRGDTTKIKSIPSATWRDVDRVWRVPLDLAVGRQLRELFGSELVLGPQLLAWARQARREERNLRSMALSLHCEPEELSLSLTHPELCEYLRPYQRAAVKYLRSTSALLGDDMGLGKTVELIAAVLEQKLHLPNLVVAPRTSLESVWLKEIESWTDHPVYIFSGEVPKDDREDYADELFAYNDSPAWAVMTSNMFRQLPWIDELEWSAFIVDEFHLTGLTNGATQTGKGSQFFQKAMMTRSERRYGVSGTPMGGKPLRLWSAFWWKANKDFPPKWQWAKTWLEVKNGVFGQDIGGLRPEKEEDFYKYHAPHMLRRLKKDVLPELPDKQYVEVICDMKPRQRRQYREFAKEAEMILDDEHLIATNKLAELSRLKAFASAECKAIGRFDNQGIRRIKLIPDFAKGGKAEPLLDRLLEGGVHEGARQAIIASQFKEVADSIHRYLGEKDFRSGLVTGGVSGKRRIEIISAFQKEELQVIVVTTTSGGVSINLDRADHVHIIDEHWDPDFQQQLEDRAHRMSRIHQVTCYYYRTRGTIEEEVNATVSRKDYNNKQILDFVRQALMEEVNA